MTPAQRDMLTSTLERAITDVCSMMLGQDVTVGGGAGEPDAAEATLQHRDGAGVRGSIEITGDLAGEATVHLPTETAVNMVSAFVGAPITPDDEAFADAVGELANMIVGSAKAHFEGLSCSISCPTVELVASRCDADTGTCTPVRRPDLCLPVTGSSGDFAVEVLLAA